MIDDELGIFLIEVNTNPCLDTSSSLLARIIPSMLENAFRFIFINLRIAVDPLFPPPNF